MEVAARVEEELRRRREAGGVSSNGGVVGGGGIVPERPPTFSEYLQQVEVPHHLQCPISLQVRNGRTFGGLMWWMDALHNLWPARRFPSLHMH